jgi:peptidoglycan/xylan/chitin deacetylase (PgdA/CDA1 family)
LAVSAKKPDDYYYTEVILGPNLKYIHKPIKLLPGIAQEFKVITKWPTIVDNQIMVEVYNNTKNKVTKQDGKFVAQIFDIKKKKVADFGITVRGTGSFTNLKVGNYALYIKSIDSSGQLKTLVTKKITITDDLRTVKIYLHNPELNNDYLNCNCVAFRLDDIQDFFLAPAQLGVLSVFDQKETPLTLGIIGSVIGTDQKIISTIKTALASDDVEIANHIWRHTLYTKMTKSDQESDLLQTNKRISDVFGIAPTTFIPPQNLYNNNTISILKSNKFTHISHGEDGSTQEPKKFQKSSFYEFPAFAYTAKLNPDTGIWRQLSTAQVLTKIDDSIFNYGYAVVMLHPYEFSVYENGSYTNKVNATKIQELGALIDMVHAAGYTTMTINQIQNLDQQKTQTPTDDVQFPNCNCVAFRLDNVQDYWLNDVQNVVLDTFDQSKTPLTLAVLGKFIGDDPKTVNHIKEKIENKSQIRIANRGWEYVDHTLYDKEKQKTSIVQTNNKISKVFGKTATIFSPPYDTFNKDTVTAASESKILYFSASIQNDKMPFPQDSLEHIPSTISFASLIDDDPFYSGTIPQKVQVKIQASVKQYGFAVISLQPSDFAIKIDVFKNDVNSQKLDLLKSIISDVKSNQMQIVMLESIPNLISGVALPDWIKNNAKWWSEGKISNNDFVLGIQYLIQNGIIVA